MKRLTRVCAVALAAAVLASPLAAWAQAPEETVRAEQLLPPNVLMYLGVTSVPELKDRWQETTLGQMAQDEALGDFLADIEDALADASADVEREIGLRLEDLWELPQGQLSLAVVGGNGKALTPIVIFEFGDQEETLNTLLEQAEDSLDEDGFERSTQLVDGFEVVTYLRPAPEGAEVDEFGEGAQAGPSEFSYFIEDGFMVVAGKVDALRGVIDRWDGQHAQTFADDPVYSYILEQCSVEDSTPVFTYFVNPVGMFTAVVTGPDAKSMGAQQAASALLFLPLLGLDRLKGLGGAVDMAAGPYNTINQALLYIEPPPTGLLNVFEFPAKRQVPPDWVTAQTDLYFAMNWDLAKAYTAVERLVDSFQGPGALRAIIDQMSEAADGPKVHLKTDLIDQLTGELHVAMTTPNPDEPESERVLIALELQDPAKMRTLLARIAKMAGFPGTTRDFRGETIYELPQDEGDAMGLAVTSGYLMASTKVAALEQVLRGDNQGPRLADDGDFLESIGPMPEETSLLTYQKSDAQWRLLWEMLRSGEVTDELSAGGSDALEHFDLSKLPPFETIEPYLRPTVSYAVPVERGAKFVSYTLIESAP